MSIELARSCLDDVNQSTRQFGLQLLQESNEFEAFKWLAVAMADEDEEIQQMVRNVFVYRLPWLELDPFMVRMPPAEAVGGYLGSVWLAIRDGLEIYVNQLDEANIKPMLLRWKQLPALLPDIIEILEETKFSDLADWLKIETGLYGNGIDNGEQLLIAPTYKCNITCSYCYSKEWDKTHGGDLSVENLMKIFDWSEANGIKEFLLAGGEPTIYRHLKLLVETAKERNIRVRLSSNGVYNKKTRELMVKPWITEITGHYDQEIMAEKPQMAEHFKLNMKAAQDSGADVILRYTLMENSDREEWMKLIELAKELDIYRINFGFSFLNTWGNNSESFYRFVPGQVNPTFEKQFLDFIADCYANGIELHQSKPIPLCAISNENLKDIMARGILRTSCPAHRRNFTQNLTVNPDMTTFPCNAVGIEGPQLESFESLKAAGDYHSKVITDLQFKPFGDSCKSCLFFYRGICQGVCLAQHHAENNLEETTVKYKNAAPIEVLQIDDTQA